MLDLSKSVTYKFGPIAVLQTCTKCFRISSVNMITDIVRCAEVCRLERTFTVDWENDKNGNHKLIITYTPLLPNKENFEYFEIFFENPKEKLIICLEGVSTGPHITGSGTLLTFRCNVKNPNGRKAFYLRNKGDVAGEFHFELENDDPHLTVSPSWGILKPQNKIRLIFNFTPNRLGIYYKKFECILRFQPPIVIELKAVHTKLTENVDPFDKIYFKRRLPYYQNTYERYLNDIVTKMARYSKPLFFIDKRYIDMGQYVHSEDAVPNTDVFTIFNNTLVPFKIIWIKELFGSFKIQPIVSDVAPKTSYEYVVTFSSKLPDVIFSRKVDAFILWGTTSEFLVPSSLSVNLIGHTFRNMECILDPFYHLDTKVVILPPTVPNIPTYATFTLYRTGILPLLFKLEPPKLPVFDVKPMQGILKKDFQIFIVRLWPSPAYNNRYMEKWELHINLFVKVELKFYASAEVPYLRFDNNFHLSFPPTYVDTIHHLPMKVMNVTRLNIRINFNEEEKNGDIFYPSLKEYVVGPTQQIQLYFNFHPRNVGVTYNCIVSAHLTHIALNGQEIKSQTFITLSGSCEDAKLTCIPEYINILDIKCATNINERLFIENQSNCKLNVTLVANPLFKPVKLVEYKMEPEKFVITPYETKEIMIAINSRLCGNISFNISYIITKDNDYVIDNDRSTVHLLKMDIYCKSPKLEIVDLRVAEEQHNFSKYFFWEMLQINEINDGLSETLVIDQPKYIRNKIPENIINSPPLRIHFQLHNNTDMNVVFNCKLLKVTKSTNDAVPVEAGCNVDIQSITSQRPKIDKKISFSYEEYEFGPDEVLLFELTAKYEKISKLINTIEFSVSIKCYPNIKRSVIMDLECQCLPENISSLDLLYPLSINNDITIQLDPVCVANSDYVVQAIWLYNNSSMNDTYHITFTDLDNIFYCLNKVHIVPPFSMHPILIRFSPSEVRKYMVNTIITTSNKVFFVDIYGFGLQPAPNEIDKMNINISLTSKFCDDHNQVKISIEHALFRAMPLHSVSKVAFFITNLSKKDLFYFHWRRKRLSGIYSISVVPEEGVLEPNKSQMCLLKLLSFYTPARLTDYINCIVINMTHAKIYLKKRKIYDEASNIAKHFFVISDKKHEEFKFPKPDCNKTIPILLKLGFSFHTGGNFGSIGFNLNRELYMLKCGEFKECELLDDQNLLSITEFQHCIQILSIIFWRILKSEFLKDYLKDADTNEFCISMVTKKHVNFSISDCLLKNLLESYIFDTLQNVFSNYLAMPPIIPETLSIQSMESPQNEIKLNNSYYEDILKTVEPINHFKTRSCEAVDKAFDKVLQTIDIELTNEYELGSEIVHE